MSKNLDLTHTLQIRTLQPLSKSLLCHIPRWDHCASGSRLTCDSRRHCSAVTAPPPPRYWTQPRGDPRCSCIALHRLHLNHRRRCHRTPASVDWDTVLITRVRLSKSIPTHGPAPPCPSHQGGRLTDRDFASSLYTTISPQLHHFRKYALHPLLKGLLCHLQASLCFWIALLLAPLHQSPPHLPRMPPHLLRSRVFYTDTTVLATVSAISTDC